MYLYHECQLFSTDGSQVDSLFGGREEVVSGAMQENVEFGMHWSSAFQPIFSSVPLSQIRLLCVSGYLSLFQSIYLRRASRK